MPLNASNGQIQLETPLLTARFGAAENPLRIPKVQRKAAPYRTQRCLENSVIYYFIDVLAGYPG